MQLLPIRHRDKDNPTGNDRGRKPTTNPVRPFVGQGQG